MSDVEEKKKLNQQDYKYIHKALLEISNGSRDEEHGICYNLQKKVLPFIEKKFIYQYLQTAIKSILKPENSQYPIEGTYEAFKANTEKWSTCTEFGNKRLYLLKLMVDHSENLSLQEDK